MKYVALFSLLILAACAQSKTTSMHQARQADAAGKDSVQKLRQQCYAGTVDRATAKVEADLVKICVEHKSTTDLKAPPTFTLEKSPRKFTFSRQAAKDGVAQEKVNLNIGINFVGADAQTVKADIVSRIKDDCLANMQYFWSSKAEIYLNLDMAADADPTKIDQQLDLDLKATDSKNTELTFDLWQDGPKFETYTTPDCDKQLKDSTGTPGQIEQARRLCANLSNQKFCLAFNKMVGHMLGAEDTTDKNCYTKDGISIDDAKAGVQPPDPEPATDPKDTDAAQKAEAAMPSFMDIIVNPQDVNAALSSPAAAPPVTPPTPKAETTSTPVSGGDAVISKLATAAAEADDSIADDLTKTKNNDSTVTPIEDRSTDPGYMQSWKDIIQSW